jgi:hypothetical protein
MDRVAKGVLSGDSTSSLAATRGRRNLKPRFSFDADEFDMSVDTGGGGDAASEEGSETHAPSRRAHRPPASGSRGALHTTLSLGVANPYPKNLRVYGYM